ncbi:MAG: glycogen synthase GlgA [Aeromonadales bacterium]|nr:glycogen synthase GlgA [Aeromonadales bacterium]
MNILLLSSEVADIMKSGGLADVAKALPLQLQADGHDVRVVMPCYTCIKGYDNFQVIGECVLNETNPNPELHIPYKIRKTYLNKVVEVWLIDCPRYFDRTSMYGDNNEAYADNGERYAFFSAAALDACTRINYWFDILHCNDWHTGIAPMLLRIKYNNDPYLRRARSVLTIHNGAFQGAFDRSQISIIPEIANIYNDKITQGSYINFLKCGVFYADKINTVSPGYAAELTTYLGGHGMTQNYLDRQSDLSGIVNGCDYSDWDPKSDQLLRIRYDVQTIDQKILGKYLLQRKLGFEMGDTPLYGMVARLTDQKGIGLLISILDRFLEHKVQLVVEGTGDPALQKAMQEIADRHPGKMVFQPVYNNTLAHRIEAASDFFLMPSIFEPCGLNQIYSLAYGTLPIVRAVGGLKDTVIDYDKDKQNGTGFMFYDPNSEELLSCLRRTLILYLEDPKEMKRIKLNAMRVRFNWSDSCKKYIDLYKSALKKPAWN